MSTEQLYMLLAGIVIIGLSTLYVGIYNSVQRLINMIPEVASNITVLAQKRKDLISKLLSIVDSYGLHESGIATRVAAEFSGIQMSSGGATSVVARLASLRMAFPELKANGLYSSLMDELADVENQIADRRERYNSTVRAYNTMLAQFPNNILLKPLSLRPKQFLTDQELSS